MVLVLVLVVSFGVRVRVMGFYLFVMVLGNWLVFWVLFVVTGVVPEDDEYRVIGFICFGFVL